MAFPKLVLALGFLLVFGWTQTTVATAIRNPRSPAPDDSNPMPSISYRRHFPSTDKPSWPPTVSVPDDNSSEYASTGYPVPSISYRKHFHSTGYPSSDRPHSTGNEDTAYPYTSPKADYVRSTDYTRRYTTPGENTASPSPKPDTARSTGYTRRYTTPGENTASPSPKPDTARSTGYTRRYTTPGENTASPSPKPDTARSTGYTRRYTTPGEDTPYPSPKPDTGPSTGNTGRTRGPSTTPLYICNSRPDGVFCRPVTERSTSYPGRYTTPGEDTAYPSPNPDTEPSTGYTGRYTTPGEKTNTALYICKSRPDGVFCRPVTERSTSYTGRYTTAGKDTAYPSTKPDTTYRTPEEKETYFPTTERYICNTYPNEVGYICVPDTARTTDYSGRYTTEGKDTARPTADFFTTPTRFICNTRPGTSSDYNFETTNTGIYSTNPPSTPTQTPEGTTATPSDTKAPTRWDPTGNCLIFNTNPLSSTWERRTTPVMWVTQTGKNTGRTWNTGSTQNTRSTWNTGSRWSTNTAPEVGVTYPWWWITTPVTKSTPDSKQITKSKPNSGSDLVPGSLKNYFFISCKNCNVFSKIDVKKDNQNTRNSNGEVMFQNMIDNMETKIDAALQNIMSSIKV